MNKHELAETLVAKVATLSLPDHEKPTPDEIRAWVAAAWREVNGRAVFRRTWPRTNRDGAAECFWRLLRWQFSPGNLHGLFSAQWLAPRDVVNRAETLATVCAVLSGRRTAADAWREALQG